jgi:hypothetical protein
LRKQGLQSTRAAQRRIAELELELDSERQRDGARREETRRIHAEAMLKAAARIQELEEETESQRQQQRSMTRHMSRLVSSSGSTRGSPSTSSTLTSSTRVDQSSSSSSHNRRSSHSSSSHRAKSVEVSVSGDEPRAWINPTPIHCFNTEGRGCEQCVRPCAHHASNRVSITVGCLQRRVCEQCV